MRCLFALALAVGRAPVVEQPAVLTLADAYRPRAAPVILSTTTETTTQGISDAIDDMLGDMCKDRPDDERCAKFTSPEPETTTTAAPETTTAAEETTTAAPATTTEAPATPAAVTTQEGPAEVTVEIKELTEHEPKVTVKKACEKPEECPPTPTPKPTPAPCEKGGKDHPCSFSAAIGLVMLALWAS
jgi:hypothetical protein